MLVKGPSARIVSGPASSAAINALRAGVAVAGAPGCDSGAAAPENSGGTRAPSAASAAHSADVTPSTTARGALPNTVDRPTSE